MADRPRVALFQAFWRFHSSTAFFALELAKAGYHVDIFLFEINHWVPIDILENADGIKVYSFALSGKRGDAAPPSKSNRLLSFGKQLGRVWQRLRRKILNASRLWLRSNKGLLPGKIPRRTAAIMDRACYKALIGIDKGGLVWAGTMLRYHASTLVYSSLELYTRDHWASQGVWDRRLKVAEEFYHRRCWATIVQDPMRGRVLLEDNRVDPSARLIFVPISRLGGPINAESRWLQEQLRLADEQVVILSYGMISEGRMCSELAHVAQSFEDNWTLVFHGPAVGSAVPKIAEVDKKDKVRLSLHLVRFEEEPMVVCSAKISLVIYGKEDSNDVLTGFSSEKLALSLQCGVPIIAIAHGNYRHIEEEGCGVLVKDIADIKDAVSRILRDYSVYRSRAFQTFEKYYRFETNFVPVLAALRELRQSVNGGGKPGHMAAG